MRLALKILVGAFAVIGVTCAAFALYVYMVLPRCTFAQTPQSVAPDGKHFAVVEWRTCEPSANSWFRVVLGASQSKERFGVVEGPGTPQLGLTWGHSAELIVSYPPGAMLQLVATNGDLPRVTLRRSDE